MASREKYDEALVVEQLHNQATCKAAFGKVIEHYSSQLYWQIRRMVIDHDDANDVLQNTFIKAWTNIDNFRGDANSRRGSTRSPSTRASRLSTRRRR